MMEPNYLQDLSNRLRPILERYGILKAIVFGSVARGEPSRRSDLDLIVVQETEKRFLDRYDGIFAEIMHAVPGRDVDLLIYTPDELARMLGRSFIRAALNEGVVIYEPERQSLSG
jgi:predicted nucleotidyltransferase